MIKRLYILLILLVAFLVWPRQLRAQVDTEFWFATPSLVSSHVPDNIWLVIVTYGDAADVSITQPARSRSLMTERRVEANSTYTYSIKAAANYTTDIETPADGVAHDNGIFIRSSVPISAYYVATKNNSEVYTLKGQHGLGTDFVVPMQYRRPCDHSAGAYCSIEVVATEDNTTVTFETTRPTNVLDQAGTITVTLQKGQTYAIRSRQANTPAAQHLGGTRVTSDKPIAVNTTDDSAATGNDKDLIGEQLVPTRWAGSHYICLSNNSAHELAYFFAIDPNPVTIYTTNGTNETAIGTLAPGQPIQYTLAKLSAAPFYTKDDTPFVLFQMTANGGELSGTVLPSLNCSGSEEVSYIPALNTVASDVTILTRTEFISGFSVNGSPQRLPASVFQPVPGEPQWSYTSATTIQLATNERTLRIRNNLGVFHLGVLDATSGACSYGYFSNFGSISMSCSSGSDYYSAGDDIRFSLVAAELFDSIWWEGPKGLFGFNDGSPVIHNATMADAGMYIVNGIHSEGCEVQPDTIWVTVLDAQSTQRTEYACPNDEVVVSATGTAPYTWYKDDELLDNAAQTYTFTATQNATFVIDQTVPGVDIFSLDDTLNFVMDRESDSLLMWQMAYDHCIPGVEYVWYVTLGVEGTNPVAPKICLYTNGDYSPMQVLTNNLTGRVVEWHFTPTDRHAVLRLVAIKAKPGRHFRVEAMSLRPVLPFTETIDVILKPLPQPVISIPDPWCGHPVRLSVTGEADSVEWNTGQKKPDILAYGPGTYIATLYLDGCKASASRVVKAYPDVQRDSTYVQMCDTLMPYLWRDSLYTEAGIYRDTIRSTYCTCDSLIYILRLDTIRCIPPELIVDFAPQHLELCDGDPSFDLTYRAVVGHPDRIEVRYGDTLMVVNPDEAAGRIEVPLTSLVPGHYNVSVLFIDTDWGLQAGPYASSFTLYYDPERVFARKWNNVLAIYSPAYSGYPNQVWTAYEWYCNGQPLGVSHSYYRIANGFFTPGDCYQVLLTRQSDGLTLFTCPFCPMSAPNAPENTDSSPRTHKVFEAGSFYIVRDEYDADGAVIRSQYFNAQGLRIR
ncbi:MAG: IgGFc-binding protein [Paludibacteraceae bacterium]|nr:IgGFc-binding protein [Paludibacteraceae bacterium]